MRRREVAVRDVDGDALFAFGPQAVGEQRQVGVFGTAGAARAGDGVELVFEDGLGIEQQPADQRGFAVVDAAGGRDAQHAGHQKYPLLLAVFHARLGDPVVGTGGTAFGDTARGDLGDDLLRGGGVRFDASGAGRVADGAEPHERLTRLLPPGCSVRNLVCASSIPSRSTTGRRCA